ncbi:protease [Lithospermum erythrorhizon]|uniref:Protease n=1 Tax=Lithospermum erythrorhizon TaxID=34254 RepID=A0AAV3NKP5_LITER
MSYILLFLWSLSLCNAQSSPKPKALLIPISKDPSTLQYLGHFSIGYPPKPTSLVLDLGGKSLWRDCENGFNSSTYKLVKCGSAACSIAKANQNCNKNKKTCHLFSENTITEKIDDNELALDSMYLQSTDGIKAGPDFIFSCSRKSLLKGLAKEARGMAGLGRYPLSLPNLLSSAFGGSLPKKFSLCLPKAEQTNGVLFFGKGPFFFYSDTNKSELFDITSFFRYTSVKLYTNPISTAINSARNEPSTEYFIKIESMQLSGKYVPLNKTLLSINNKGYGGTKLSTVTPYTILESSIYKALTELYDDQFGYAVKVPPVAPFTKCYTTERLLRLPVLGWGVPWIEVFFDEAKDVRWTLYGTNTMVEVGNNTVCFAFVDGGVNTTTSIVIGAYQMEDQLFEFDLASSKLGISSSLHWDFTQCSNFNF